MNTNSFTQNYIFMDTIKLSDFASQFDRFNRCKAEVHPAKEDAENRVESMLEILPHGSGIDNGVKFLWDESTKDKLIFQVDFHHMDDNGYYCGWSEHKLILTPSFTGFEMRLTGKNYRQIKEYLYDLFSNVFSD